MLVLARKKNETIVINENIVITLLGVNSNRIKIGVDAPKGVRIVRGEIAHLPRKRQAKRDQP